MNILPNASSGSQSHTNENAISPSNIIQNEKSSGNQRNRPQLSCVGCRSSKLKCDRKSPCAQCIKKGKASQCTFPIPMTRRKQAGSMQSRLRHLESLVKNAMTAQSLNAQYAKTNQSSRVNHDTEIFSNDSTNSSFNPKEAGVSVLKTGQVLQGTNEATYLGGSNWAAIFENIEEIQNYFNEDDGPELADTITSFTDINFTTRSTTTKSQLLAMLPDRTVVDRLVSTHFNSNSPGLQIIHRPTFEKQYQAFWRDMVATPVSWLGLLFSILVLASVGTLATTGENSDQYTEIISSIRPYREACVQCLILSNYTRPGPHTIETLAKYMEGDFLLSKDDQVHLYLLVGNTIRLAMRMGLHRDSSKIRGDITPFQAEMRRRVWHHLFQIDILSSFQIGLPGMTSTVESDTRYPSNLRDEDFDEDSVKLPPPRPDSELTPMTYTISKSHISHIAGKIAAITNGLTLPSYEVVLRLDKQLDAAYQKVPTFFQLADQTFITDAPERIIKRFSLAFLYQKSRCLLHRSFMLKGHRHPEFAYSKKACLDASMELLRFQTLFHEAALQGGALSKDRWFLSSLSMHDFLLAAMVVYMSVMQSIADGVPTSYSPMIEMIASLAKSQNIWTKHWTNISEAKKAASILTSMLGKIQTAVDRSAGIHSATKSIIDGLAYGNGHGISQADINAGLALNDNLLPSDPFQPVSQFTNWASSDSASPSTGFTVSLPAEFDASMIPLEGFTDFSTEFDWELFDSELRPPQTSNHAWPGMNDDFLTGFDTYY